MDFSLIMLFPPPLSIFFSIPQTALEDCPLVSFHLSRWGKFGSVIIPWGFSRPLVKLIWFCFRTHFSPPLLIPAAPV